MILLFFKVKLFFMKEAKEARRRFPTFLPCERALKKAYRFRNPYQVCKAYLKSRGEMLVDAYGETPLPALAKIAEECGMSSRDHVVELGCGRGRAVFFWNHYVGCVVRGVDWVPLFIETARNIAHTLSFPPSVCFSCQDMLETDLTGTTVIYLYGTCLPDDVIYALTPRFAHLSSDVKIITVSYPLSDYSSRFTTLKTFSVSFPWGEGEVFLNQKVKYE